MLVSDMPITDLVRYERNPRINDDAVQEVARSIERFGFRQPIVADEDRVILVGDTRLLAAEALGLATVPVHIAEGLSDEQKRAYRIADNKVGELAKWDKDLLAFEIGELAEFDADSLPGFTEDEIHRLLRNGEQEGEDEIPIDAETRTKPGDLWVLGKHRLLCGDATSADDVGRLLGDVQPHLMVTDPPYGVAYDSNWRAAPGSAGPNSEGSKRNKGGAHLPVTNDQSADWREAWALFPGDVAYVWHAGNKAHIVAESLEASGLELRAQVIWAKNNIVIGRGHYHPKHEPCWYAVRKGKTGHWSGSRKESTLWNIDKPMKSETGHSTQKPVECMRRPIVNNSSVGQVVYDPFLGSGTTIIAAETEQRACYGLELEPAYCDIIIARWEQFTGEEAVLDA